MNFKAALILTTICLMITSCSLILSSVDTPVEVSHSFVEGVTPANTSQFNQRTYPTVRADWPGPGGDKLWLAVNLGATAEPESSVDSNADRAGWYFQFNRKQGFYHSGTQLIPQWRFSSINENSFWQLSNDPCRILLGEDWRLPNIEEVRTFREASRASGAMGEGNRTDAFNSTLRLHSAGELATANGELRLRGEAGRIWARDQFTPRNGEVLGYASDGSSTFGSNKAFARPVRCISDEL
jgi:hypothetical protein